MQDYYHLTQYYETDQMRIVHHSNYIRWFEEARTHFLKEIGFGYDRMEEEGLTCPVMEVQCRYLSMVRFPDRVRIHCAIYEYSGVRLGIRYIVYDELGETVRATGQSLHCFLNDKGRPVHLSKANPNLHMLFEKYSMRDDESN
ncbi:MAG: acyl-CoA thioesterase [Clostridiaceae bacterium]|nr:acyl-CoA thioesterase [Clostridiaceae bacterium]